MVDFGESVALPRCRSLADSRRGATMWCVAPEWPEHARHVAVEFVHPVLVGKRALPAVSVESARSRAALRSLVRSGDVVLAVSRGDSHCDDRVMRRAEAWGATTVWLGVGASARRSERPITSSGSTTTRRRRQLRLSTTVGWCCCITCCGS